MSTFEKEMASLDTESVRFEGNEPVKGFSARQSTLL